MIESDMFIARLSRKALGLLTLEKRAWSMAYCGYVVTLLSVQPEPRRRDLRTSTYHTTLRNEVGMSGFFGLGPE
ncbi:hypothetical protein CY34DRAFT_217495 [Suillus luteus UH-Slu-Lm8-n1]|uniref:Uncharacterized protein n=1 Tax=Suillus luteus UH-Slu-Lm8-n1 TaxID=930992 RepID=A0A0D0ATE9_9AGAM|nr:hypothetical protein CY34DRAFT_217495 [Suillus luteus UH-Slu-Lm8-n1]